MNLKLRELYDLLPPSYELINSIMTLGMDKSWRRRTVELAKDDSPPDTEQFCLDLCCGTGDTIVELKRLLPSASIIGADFSFAMLSRAKAKEVSETEYTLAAAEQLPFACETFDVVTMTFATRNVKTSKQVLIKAFAEIKRVLKPDGCFVTVETSQPPSAFIGFFFRLYVRLFVTPIGLLFSGVKDGYVYLTNSILSFYKAEELSELLKDAGFSRVEYEHLLFGGIAIHRAQ